MVGRKEPVRLAGDVALEYASIASVFAAPAPAAAPVPKAQQVIEKAQAAGLPTEKDLAESELLITADGQLPEPQPTAADVQTQHILDGIAPQLAQLMTASQVQPSELQAVVGKRAISRQICPCRTIRRTSWKAGAFRGGRTSWK